MRQRMRTLVARPLGAGLRLVLANPPVERLVERALVVLRHRYPDARALAWLAGECLRALERRGAGDFVRVATLPGGAKLGIDVRDDWQRGLYYRGAYEPETTRLVRELVRPGDVVLDVGANAGYYSCLAAAQGARVHAFEPTPALARLLHRTRELNGWGDRLVVNDVAVSDREGVAEFFLSPQPGNTGLSSLLPMPHLGAGSQLSVPVVTLDGYCAERGIGEVRLLKVDVEGAELEVLRGAARVLSEIRPDAIVCEVGGFADGCRPTDVIALLAEAGYAPYAITRTGLAPFAPSDGEANDAEVWEQRNLCFLRPAEPASALP